MEIQFTQPVAKADRIRTIDMVRGVALLGILMMNIPGFGINNYFWYGIMTGSHNDGDYYTFAAVMVLFEGTMRGLFSMLFGAGMMLFMMNKQEVPGKATVAEYYYRRLLWLVFFGLVNAYVFLWGGDILFFYGLCGMLLFPFRKLAAKWLLIIGLLCVCFAMIKKQWNYNELLQKRTDAKEAMAAKENNKELTPQQQGAIAVWTDIEQRQKPDSAAIKKQVEEMRGNYFTVLNHLIPENADFEISYMYYDPWDMLCMMFIGMALFAWGFFNNKLKTSTYAMCALLGYAIGLPISWMMYDRFYMGFASPTDYIDTWRSSHMIFQEFRRIPIAIGHASLVMLVFRSGAFKWLMRALANVGQMAFTNYLMQSIICSLFFYGYGLGYFDKLSYYELYFVVGGVWIFQLIFSSIWLNYFRFGPFEWLWRSLTYWKKQPMRQAG